MLNRLQVNISKNENKIKLTKEVIFKTNLLECAKTCSILSNTCKGFTFWSVNSANYCFLKNFTLTPRRTPSYGRNLFES